jgi:lipopolysaccharide export system protein LptC
MTRWRYLAVLLMVLAVALFTRWLLQSVEPHGPLVESDLQHIPDYFVADFNATVFDAAGKPYYKLKATRVEHYPDDETVHIQFPEIQFLKESTRPWLASAQSGIVYLQRDELYLQGNVLLANQTNDSNELLQLQTQEIVIDLTKRTVNTKDKVYIRAKNSTISATGMHLDLTKSTLVLDANAKGVYVPR